MMLIMGQCNRVWHFWCGRYPKSVGVLICPSYGTKVPVDRWMPFVLDCDSFTCWRDGRPWDESAWFAMLSRVKLTGLDPLWCVVPDAVGNRDETLAKWPTYAPVVRKLGWKTAFCVQDGMDEADVPSDADVVAVGGTDRWKFPNLHRWTSAFPRVHVFRVNSPEMIESCERMGCESIDGTGWFRDPSRPDKLPAIERFIEGYRNQTPYML